MATPIFACGAECGHVVAEPGVGQHLISRIGTPTIDTTTKRNGARSVRCNAAGVSVAFRTVVLASGTRWVGRFAVYFATALPNVDTTIAIVGASGAGPGVRFKVSDSKIYATVTTTLGASGVSVVANTWYYIDFDFNIQTAGADFSDVKVNGTACGQATATGTSAAVTTLEFGPQGVAPTADVYIDDIIISQTAADYPLGDGYVNHFVPTSDGTHNVAGTADFRRGELTTDILNSTTDAYLLVDDVPLDDVTPDTNDHIRIVAPPNATDYVELVFGPAPGISTPTAAPRAVEVIAEFFAAGTGLADEILKLNDNGTVDDVYVGTQVAGTTTGIYKRKHYASGPAGAWTVVAGAGNFNNLRARYGYASDANPDKSLMCVMVEAEFAPGGGPTQVSLAGSQPASTGTIAKLQLLKKTLSGAQPTATGSIAARQTLLQAVAGSQPSASGVVSVPPGGIGVAGAQPAATGSLAVLQTLGASLAGNQPAATGTLAQAYRINTAGSQPAATGTIAALQTTAVISGTAGDGATEAEIVAGGQTIVITLTNDTWIPA